MKLKNANFLSIYSSNLRTYTILRLTIFSVVLTTLYHMNKKTAADSPKIRSHFSFFIIH